MNIVYFNQLIINHWRVSLRSEATNSFDSYNILILLEHLSSPFRCSLCGSSSAVKVIQMPYACKLLFQELAAMNILPRITLDSPIDDIPNVN